MSRDGPADLDGSIDEAIAELRSGYPRGFMLTMSDGETFKTVYHDVPPDEWAGESKFTDVSRIMFIASAVAEVHRHADGDPGMVDVLATVYDAWKAHFAGMPSVDEYKRETGSGGDSA